MTPSDALERAVRSTLETAPAMMNARGDCVVHPNRYWWHNLVRGEVVCLAEFGLKLYPSFLALGIPNTLACDAERYIAEMISWGELRVDSDGEVVLCDLEAIPRGGHWRDLRGE